jgi:hypothetical protein
LAARLARCCRKLLMLLLSKSSCCSSVIAAEVDSSGVGSDIRHDRFRSIRSWLVTNRRRLATWPDGLGMPRTRAMMPRPWIGGRLVALDAVPQRGRLIGMSWVEVVRR